MSDSVLKSQEEEMTREELMSALFAHLVIQNTNMAMMFLGKVAHPQSGEKVTDVDGARMFIDQLEMLEFKTKGNLNAEEQKLLQQSLTHLRLTFVEAVEQSTDSKPQAAPAVETTGDTAEAPTDDSESRKKFSKKY